jgi:membrane associated rhomboid family serine protease
MVLPLHDDAKLKYMRVPVVNLTLIMINVVIFLIVHSEILGDPLTIMRGFAVIPRVMFGEASLAHWIIGPPPPATLFTALFFHSSLMHIIGNMLFLYVFGDNIEDAMGSLHYFLFYICCGVASGLAYMYAEQHSVTPLVGASGAISGVCAAFLLLFPRATIFGLAAGVLPIHASAFVFVGTWILLQVASVLFSVQGHTAWIAHVGGIVAGLALTPLFKRRSVPLFGPAEPPRVVAPASVSEIAPPAEDSERRISEDDPSRP